MFIWFQKRKFAENKNFIMNKLSRYRKRRYNQLFESENRELRLNEICLSDISIDIRLLLVFYCLNE